MAIIHIPFHEGYAPGAWEGDEDLLFRLPDDVRPSAHSVHYIDRTGSARRDPAGPELPGPYAFLTPRVVRTDGNRPGHLLTPNDLVEVGGVVFKPRATVDYVELDAIAHTATSSA